MIIDQLILLKYGLFALGVYWSSMLICFLSSLFIWHSAKDRTYLYLALFILLMGAMTPFGPTTSGPDFSSESGIHLFQLFSLFALIANHIFYKFMEHFYKLTEGRNSFNKLLRIPIYVGWTLFPFILLSPSHEIYSILTVNIMFLTILVIYLFVKETIKDRSNFWMAFGNLFFQICITIYLSNSFHYIRADLIYLVLAGGFIQALFFTVASGIRYEKSRRNLQHLSKIALLGEISTGIAHEIKNPLSIAFSRLEIVNSLIADSVELKQHTISAQNKVHQALTIVTRI